MEKIADKEIIDILRRGEYHEVDRILTYLHKRVYRQVKTFIGKYYGTTNDAEDVFQDGLLSIYKLARRGDLNQDTNAEAYLFAICKNLWFQQLRKKREIVSLEDNLTDFKVKEVGLFRMMKQEEKKEIFRLLEQMGENCRNVLIDFYYRRVRMREIAERMGYSSEQVAKNRKSECLKKLRKLMHTSPVFERLLNRQ